jgi:hypothetical protein
MSDAVVRVEATPEGELVAVDEYGNEIPLEVDSLNLRKLGQIDDNQSVELVDDLDAKGNNIENASSVSTESADITTSLNGDLDLSNDATNPTNPLTFTGSDFALRQDLNDVTVQGDNTATTIAQTSAADGRGTQMLVIGGVNQGNVQQSFTDVYLVAGATNGSLELSHQRNAVTRSYSQSGAEVELAIDDSGSTYKLGVTQLGGWLP